MTVLPVRGLLNIPHRRHLATGLRVIDLGYQHFVSPTATGGGSGSFESPWTLSEFLANPGTINPGEVTGMRCVPGSELYEQSGSFTWSSTLNGTSGTVTDMSKKIILRNYAPDGGLPTISTTGTTNNQTLRIDGTHVVLRGIRIRKNNTIRNDGRGTALWLRGAFDNQPTGTGMLIQCWFEDGANGLFTGNSASTDFQGGDWIVYGCVGINNGEDDGPRNHCIYSRHQGDGRLVFEKNIFGMGLANSLMVYEEAVGVDAITNVDIIDNICFQAGILGTQTGNWWNMILGGGGAADGPARECEITNNILWHATNDAETANLQLGSIGATNEHVIVQDNKIYRGDEDDIIKINPFRTDGNPTLVFKNNRTYRGADRGAQMESGSLTAWTWQGNTWYTSGSLGQNIFVHGGVQRTLDGLIANAGIGDSDTDSVNPTGNQVFTFAVTAYASVPRLHAFIVNWAGSTSISIDLDEILVTNDQFKIYRAQNPHVAITQGGETTFTYTTGVPFSYNMAAGETAVQAPIGTCPRTAPALSAATPAAECLIFEKVT